MSNPISRPLYDRPFPRGPLIGAALVVGVALIAAATGRYTRETTLPTNATVVASRDLRFEDQADGSVLIEDARDGQRLGVAAGGTNGFMRTTLRGLARERTLEGSTARGETAFRVTAWSDNRVTLDDPATGRHIELEAFGPTNEAAFAQLLPRPGTPAKAIR
jgi:putative photosynthetic complex assembly protein